MKLILRRDQQTGGLISKTVTFYLDVRAALDEQEQANVRKYKLGDTVLYERKTLVDPGSGLLGAASRLAFKATNLSLKVDDLANGKRIDCKDIVEMLAIEEQVKEAAHTFKLVLNAAAQFGGEEVIAIE
jgi:hypothetical protein